MAILGGKWSSSTRKTPSDRTGLGCASTYEILKEWKTDLLSCRPIADRYNLDQEAVLDNVLYSRAYTSEQQMGLLDFVCAKFHEEPGIFKLLVVDSVMALFRVDFSGRGELAERQQALAQMMSKLQKISEVMS